MLKYSGNKNKSDDVFLFVVFLSFGAIYRRHCKVASSRWMEKGQNLPRKVSPAADFYKLMMMRLVYNGQ